jgi:energy-coupling factor transporter ATP-binding protein EcfA2
MSNHINKIARVEIKSLWNRFDLLWELDTDVNILSGINGSGKSTILSCIANLIINGQLHETLVGLVEKVVITFSNDKFIVFEHLKINDTIRNIEKKAKKDDRYKTIITDLKEREGANYKKIKSVQLGMNVTSLDNMEMTLEELHELLHIDIVSTFDNEILEAGKKPDEQVRTELDRDIFRLQKRYLDYQLNISKKKDLIIDENKENNIKEKIEKLRYPQNRFLEIIDILFKGTDKKINRAENEITFICNDKAISPYQLSSGEKQMLVILLTVLVQDSQESIIFMDEPEISLHFDWQKKLIQFIKELNPNTQIILATHSPAVIIEGWTDKVSEVRDLIIKDKKALKTQRK